MLLKWLMVGLQRLPRSGLVQQYIRCHLGTKFGFEFVISFIINRLQVS